MSYSDAYKAEAVAIARRLDRPALADVLRELPPNQDGRRPSRNALNRWICEAGVEIHRYDASEHWPDETRNQAVRLVRSEGLTPASASQHIRRKTGRAPRETLIARWVGLSPVNMDEARDDGPDLWEQAWDAAEGLEGAAWAEAVLKAWLPPSTFDTEGGVEKPLPARLRRLAA